MAVAVVAHAVATLFLCGLVWTVQVVHYPLFALVGTDGFPRYQAGHTARIGWLVTGPWAVEGVAVAAMLLITPPGVAPWLVWVAAAAAAWTVAATAGLAILWQYRGA